MKCAFFSCGHLGALELQIKHYNHQLYIGKVSLLCEALNEFSSFLFRKMTFGKFQSDIQNLAFLNVC